MRNQRQGVRSTKSPNLSLPFLTEVETEGTPDQSQSNSKNDQNPEIRGIATQIGVHPPNKTKSDKES